jgi:hypothetical protein
MAFEIVGIWYRDHIPLTATATATGPFTNYEMTILSCIIMVSNCAWPRDEV